MRRTGRKQQPRPSSSSTQNFILLLLLPHSFCPNLESFSPHATTSSKTMTGKREKKRKQVLLLYIWRNHAAARPPTFLHERVSVCFGRQRRRLLLLKRKCTWMMIFSLSSVDGAGQLYGNQLTGVRNDVGGWGDISSDRPLKRKEKESSSRRHMAASS